MSNDEINSAEWQAEVDRLQDRIRAMGAENARLQKALDVCCVVHGHNVKLKTERDQTRATIARLRGVLGKLEWCNESESLCDSSDKCPVCDYQRVLGHASSCALAAALAEES